MARRRSSRGNIPPHTPIESNPPNLRRSSRGIASTALAPPEYNPHNLCRSSRGIIAAAECNSPKIHDTQHSQEFQSKSDEYEDPEGQEFVQTGTTGKRKRAGSSARKQRKKNTISQPRKRKLSLIGSTSYTAGADFDYPKIASTEICPSLTLIRKTAICMEADGSCLFHALADQLYNDPDRSEELRKTVVEYMADNRNVFKAMLPLRDVHDSQSGELALRWDEDAQFDEYLRLLVEMEPGEENWRFLPRQNTSALPSSSIRTKVASSATTTTSEAFQPILGIRGNSSTTTLQEMMSKPFVMVHIAIWTPSIPKLLSATTNVLKASPMMTLISVI